MAFSLLLAIDLQQKFLATSTKIKNYYTKKHVFAAMKKC
jgi:hypothetical protein